MTKWDMWSALAGWAGVFVSLATLYWAFLTFTRALPDQLNHFRVTKREEQQAEVAQQVWVAFFRMTMALIRIRSSEIEQLPDEMMSPTGERMSIGDTFLHLLKPYREALQVAGERLEEAQGLAGLFLGPEVTQGIHELFEQRRRIEDLLETYGYGLARSPRDVERGRAVFETIVEAELRARMGGFREVLLTFALLGDASSDRQGKTGIASKMQRLPAREVEAPSEPPAKS